MKKSVKYLIIICLVFVLGFFLFNDYKNLEERKLDDTSTLLLIPNENEESINLEEKNNDNEEKIANENNTNKQTTSVKKNTNANTNKEDTATNENTKTDTAKKSTSVKENTKTSTSTQSETDKESTKTSTSKQNTAKSENTKTDTTKKSTNVKENTKTSTNKQNAVVSENTKNKTATNEDTKKDTNKENINIKENTKTSTSKQDTTTNEKKENKTATNENTKTEDTVKQSTNNDEKVNTNEEKQSSTNNPTITDIVNINDNRCYKDNATTILYYITECDSNTCKYTKKNGNDESGTVIRKKLSYNTNNCGSNKIVKDGDIIGATGFTAVNNKKYLKSEASNNSTSIALLEVGEPFIILSTNNNDTWWKVNYKGNIGYVENTYCMINLPDYIPSINFMITNAYNNIYNVSGTNLSITGNKLYKTGKVYNQRLERDEFIVPVVYSFAKKILIAQNKSQSEGYSLKIYDAYRPKHVADNVKESLAQLYRNNSSVRNNIDYSYENGKKIYWGQGWFIAQSLSAHSVGTAIDVVLVDKNTGVELVTQTAMHDLSTNAVKYSTPITGQTKVKSNLYSSKANKQTKDLDRIMLSTGMTNLASEWWHFQDNDAYKRIKNIEPNGLDFEPDRIVSTK